MDTFFIDNIQTYVGTNKKGNRLQRYITEYEQTLVNDKISFNKLKDEIKGTIKKLNEEYPRTQPLELNESFGTKSGQWIANVKGNPDKIVFILSWKKILGIYQIL